MLVSSKQGLCPSWTPFSQSITHINKAPNGFEDLKLSTTATAGDWCPAKQKMVCTCINPTTCPLFSEYQPLPPSPSQSHLWNLLNDSKTIMDIAPIPRINLSIFHKRVTHKTNPAITDGYTAIAGKLILCHERQYCIKMKRHLAHSSNTCRSPLSAKHSWYVCINKMCCFWKTVHFNSCFFTRAHSLVKKCFQNNLISRVGWNALLEWSTSSLLDDKHFPIHRW